MDRPPLREIAKALGGEVVAGQVLGPGPNHSRKDRSLSVILNAKGEPVVHSFCGDDWRECLDYVNERVGFAPAPKGRSETRRRPRRKPALQRPDDDDGRQRVALRLWDQAKNPHGTIIENYLVSRGLELCDDIADICFLAACPFSGETHPAMICLVRNIISNEPQGIHRTALTPAGGNVKRDGGKNLRLTLGPIKGGAIKIDDDADVTMGLTIGEGLETCLTTRQAGLRPVWSVITASGIADFPVLPGIDGLHLLAEHDASGTNARAIEKCGQRWREAGRQVIVVDPSEGNDLNDALRARAST